MTDADDVPPADHLNYLRLMVAKKRKWLSGRPERVHGQQLKPPSRTLNLLRV